MKKIAIIPARAGSKGLPNKNMLLAQGKPLMAYTVEAALEAGVFDKIVVSTDSEEYIAALSHYPIDFIRRDAALAGDGAGSFVVVEDVLQRSRFQEWDYFVLLQPTSPLRNAAHIQAACLNFERQAAEFDFSVSVAPADKPASLVRPIDGDGSLKFFDLDYSNYARQRMLPEFSPNGAIFIAKPQAYLQQKHFFGAKSLAFVMDKADSVDIDTRQDFEYFYAVLQQRKRQEIVAQRVQNRIIAKQAAFAQTAPLTLIGHSIIDQWSITELNGSRVANLGIGGISSRQYWEQIVQAGRLQHIGAQVLIMLGVNDMTAPQWQPEQTLDALRRTVAAIRRLRQDAQIWVAETLPTAFRIDRDNAKIRALNAVLRQGIDGAQILPLAQAFSDRFGKLDLTLTDDGLHLNAAGYSRLQALVGEALK